MKVEVIVPKSLFNADEFKRLAAARTQSAAMAAKRDFEATTRGWNHQVEFYIQKDGDITFVGTDDDIYAIVNNGSPSHSIDAVNAPTLVFPSEYKAKTSPGVIGSKQGGKFGTIIRKKHVNHPGFEARRFDQIISDKHGLNFTSGMEDALSEANK